MADAAPCLVVKDSWSSAVLRTAVAAVVAVFCLGYVLDPPTRGPDFPAKLVGGLALLAAVVSLRTTRRPQTRLIINAGGIWADSAGSVAWSELRGYRSAYYTVSDAADKPSFIFLRQQGPEIQVDLDDADADINSIRRFLARLDTGYPLHDEGHRQH